MERERERSQQIKNTFGSLHYVMLNLDSSPEHPLFQTQGFGHDNR